ncbi:UNKNOWN [Stylonychia lemnae]|uniref:Uncharacterized protein n=1 Tax=Stylonychia lemnae TaxID=5949 RepID=A0A078AZY8_STYLE|nr:UNKNOWN [Stylonychia lemnae]|eukprot:CDW87980.1 UNKNOWN [Stylonychia lemnae]
MKVEDDPRYDRFLRVIFVGKKFQIDQDCVDKNRLNERVNKLCQELHINADDLYDNNNEEYFEQLMRAYGPIENKKKKKSPYIGNTSLNISLQNSLISPTSSGLPTIQNNFQFSPPSKLQQFGISNTNFNSPTSMNLGGSGGSPGVSQGLNQSTLIGHRASIRLTSTLNLNSPQNFVTQQSLIQHSQNQSQEPKKPVTVGKISFRPARAPMSSQRRSQLNLSPNSFITQPQGIDTQSNYQVQLAQKMYEKEKDRVEKFKKVRQNAINLAQQTVQRYQEKLNHKIINFDRFKQNMQRKNQEDQKRIEMNQQKRANARDNLSRTLREIETKSQSIHDIRFQEISQLTNKRSQREKQMSTSQFLTFKKKIEEEQMNQKIMPKVKKRENQEIGLYLQRLEYKIQKGQEKAQKILHDTNMMRTSKFESMLQETQNKHRGIIDHHFNRSLDRVITKDSQIENKIKKKIAQEDNKRNHIRQIISQKFDRSRSIRDDLKYQDDRKKKETIEKLEYKMQKPLNVSQQRDIETQKKREMNSLRQLDVQENYRSVKDSILLQKAKVMTKMHKIDEVKRQAEEHNKKVIEKLKFNNLIAERNLLQDLNPREILVKAKLNLTLQATGQSPKNSLRLRNSNRNSVSHNEN